MIILLKFKKSMQKSIFPQKIQKSLCITTKSLYTNSKFQTQLSRKLQRFRTCRKNKKCSIFHDLSEYTILGGISFLHTSFFQVDWSYKKCDAKYKFPSFFAKNFFIYANFNDFLI